MGAESVEARLAALASSIEELSAQCVYNEGRAASVDLDTIWLIIGAVGVFSMQSGFAMLEVGSCARDHTKEILLKNIMDVAIGAVSWWSVGYALAQGSDSFGDTGVNGVAGTSGFFYAGDQDTARFGKLHGQAFWFFQLSFAATSATIVSGAIAERCKMVAYLMIGALITAIIYPIVAHVAWTSHGRLSPYRHSRLLFDCGVIDFAGSGVVHITGGCAALIAAYAVGPRAGRFNSRGEPVPMRQQSVVLQVLGTLTLWIGWFYFNAVSTLSADRAGLAAHCCFNTILASSAASISSTFFHCLINGYLEPQATCNGILSGLVAVTAGCATSNATGAVLTGLVAGPLYLSAVHAVETYLKVDDVCHAVAVHGANGVWGLIAAALFATPWYYDVAYDYDRGSKCAGLFYGGGGRSLGAALVFVVAIIAWVAVPISGLFLVINRTIGSRSDVEDEEESEISDDEHNKRTVANITAQSLVAPESQSPTENAATS